MNDNPGMLLLMGGVGIYVAWLWRCDLRAAMSGENAAGGLPGATPAPLRSLMIASFGALLILLGETFGEIALGVQNQQSRMTLLFAAYTLVAAIIEEVIFRGYLVVEKRGRRALVTGILVASLGFALIHPFLWSWDDDGFALTLNIKGYFSFIVVFISSLWFYTCRFAPWNPQQSLLPCFAAHLTKNAGVIVIKAAQGYLVGII